MTLKDDLKDYITRMEEVEAFINEERRTASLELRWRQLNAAFATAKELGLLHADPSEAEVHERWARIKEIYANQHPKS